MDSKLIKQYGVEILSYRLRTVRQRNRMQYEDFDKKLLRLNKEEKKLIKLKRNLGWEPLIPPVQKGWKRFFVLREDIAHSKHAAFFENVLKKINTYDWSHRKDFRIKYRKFGTKKYKVKGQNLLRPCGWQFQRLGFTDEEKQFFSEVWEADGRKEQVKRYVFSEPWRYVLRVRPNIIDKVKRRDEVIEKRLKEINNYLNRNNYWPRLEKLLRGNRYNGWKGFEDPREKHPFRNKAFHQILHDIDAGLM